MLSYQKPSQCNVVGSYVSRTMVKTQPYFAIDMVVQMPSSLFQSKDYMNMRYFYRRAYYIAYIAAHIRKDVGKSFHSEFQYLHDNPLLPILVLRPQANQADPDGVGNQKTPSQAPSSRFHYTIRILPCSPDELFPWSKLTPSSSCVHIDNAPDKKPASTATPFYNSTLNAERTFISFLRVLTRAKNECPSFVDACILGRVWLHQRGFGSAISRGGFGNFEWAVVMALLMQAPGANGQATLSPALSSTELFKAVIHFLATIDLGKKPLVLGTASISSSSVQETGPVLFDPARELNILFKMTPWSASLLQLYAKSTADLLADEAAEKFDATFIIKVDVVPLLYNANLEISSPLISSRFSSWPDRTTCGYKFSLEAHKVLKRAYGDRVQLVHPQLRPLGPWPISEVAPVESAVIDIRIVSDPICMARQMEYGPPADEQKEAASFRQFWGDKAELRRFKDGRILECVEWKSRVPSRICEDIASFALKRHLGLADRELKMHTDECPSSILSLSHVDKEAFDSVSHAFSSLERDIRTLEGLPLQIRQLSPVSPMSRYSSIQSPMLGFHQGSVEPVEVNLYFEASSKWPENLIAIQETKIELLLDIDKRLTAARNDVTTHLGRENMDVGIEPLAYLDIVYHDGGAFRLKIHCDMEETLLERRADDKTVHQRVRDEAAVALAELRWQFGTLPLHSQMMATACTRFHALSPSIRLAKQWFNQHKLRWHVGEPLIELFVLHVFLQPYPWPVPSSAALGFLRTLFFLSRWDWRHEPLIVDPAAVFSRDERASYDRELASWRQRDPLMNRFLLLVATPGDRTGLAYSRDGPSKLVAARVTRLAKAACRLVREQQLPGLPPALFQPSLGDYDILIRLSPQLVRKTARDAARATDSDAIEPRFKNLDRAMGELPLPVRIHAVDALVDELRRVYDGTLVFFHGASDDPVVAALWAPRSLQRHQFRTGLPYNVRSARSSHDDDGDDDATGADSVELNRSAILLEIARAGGDMIRKIEALDMDAQKDG